MASPRRVSLVHSEEDTPETPDRARMTTALLHSLELFPRLTHNLPAPRVKPDELCRYHSRAYVDLLRAIDSAESGDAAAELDEAELDSHGLSYDADAFPGVWAHATTIAGGSLRAAELLARGETDVAIHWQGGRHHATSDRAAGFCYANDVVLAALQLLATFRAVVVIDADIHHGNGTEDAFRHTPSVLNVSLHLHAPGFYPGTGALADRGHGRGAGATVNVPLRRGLGSAAFRRVFAEVAGMCRRWIGERSCAVVLVCGADGLSGDPRGGWNLQPADLAEAVGSVLQWRLPTLLLGGGGYVPASAARAWALCTMRALQLPADGATQIPPESAHFERYRDGGFLLAALGSCTHTPDENSDEYVREVISTLRARFVSPDGAAAQPAPTPSASVIGVKRMRNLVTVDAPSQPAQ